MDVKTPKGYPGSVEAALHSSPRTTDDKSRAQVIKDYKLAVEYKWLKKQAPGGVYVMPSPKDLRLWHGVIFVRKAMYSNGIFKFRIELPSEYNDVGVYPCVFFVTPVFNPLVHPQTGELDLASSFPEWNPDQHYLITVLTFLKKIFYMKDFPPLPAPPNREAHSLAASDKAEFLRRVEECVAASQENVYVPNDGSLLRFTEAKPAHQQLAKAIKDAYESSLSGSTSSSGSSASHDESSRKVNIMQVIRSVVEATFRPQNVKGPS